MTESTLLGFPRIGKRRELKRALERHWSGETTEAELLATATELRREHWLLQTAAGIDRIPSNDFSLYDHVLDTTLMLGATPERYRGASALASYFAMARGNTATPALEMTKWFDTNYHFLVPELPEHPRFELSSQKALHEYLEAKALGIETRPVLLGPLTWLSLAKSPGGAASLQHLERVVDVYVDLLSRLSSAGAAWVQLDEPALVLDLDAEVHAAYRRAYARLVSAAHPQILLATYFGPLGNNQELAVSLGTAGVHVDLVRAPEQLAGMLGALDKDQILSLGVVDGRNVWKTDYLPALDLLDAAAKRIGNDRLLVAPSCSLLHAPFDLDTETHLPPDVRRSLAFAVQKLAEVKTLARAVDDRRSVSHELLDNSRDLYARRVSTTIHLPEVKSRVAAVEDEALHRPTPFAKRRQAQATALRLPLFPTTTIGSFPQTADLRKARARHTRGELGQDDYDAFLRAYIKRSVHIQEDLGLDVLVHGEPERTDMVEYFGEKLDGMAVTENGWVQSYGSRCVKPPIVFGDVRRATPMTVEWSRYAQSCTKLPVKGMLTGPVTILKWSFVRDDQPLADTCRQLALAIRDEVQDLEAAGLAIIQVDEPALREGLPLRQAERREYLDWAVSCFRLATSGVRDATQIHTHMCYCDFNDVMSDIAALDADVISIETSRSNLELFEGFAHFHYPNDVGPGVYDIHSPRIPDQAAIVKLLERALHVLPAERIWVNPDCGLKTRSWEEVTPALANLVASAREMRARVGAPSASARPAE